MKKKISSCESCFQFFILRIDVVLSNLLIVNLILGEDPRGQDLDLKMTKSDSKCVVELHKFTKRVM